MLRKICLIFGLFYLVYSPLYAQDAGCPLKLDLKIIEPPSGEFVVGAFVRSELTIKNVTDHLVNIIRPLDGSTISRYPLYEQHIQRPLPSIYPSPDTRWFGTFNPLRKEDFIALQPGQSCMIDSRLREAAFTPYTAGVYAISYRIRFNSEDQLFYGSMDISSPLREDLQKMLNIVPRVDIQSETCTITVKSNNKTLDPKYHCVIGMPKDEFMRLFMRDYIPRTFDTDTVVTISLYPLNFLVHFTDSDIADGIMTVNGGIDLNQFLLWARGDHQEIPYRSRYNEGAVGVQYPVYQVGYFATSNADGFNTLR